MRLNRLFIVLFLFVLLSCNEQNPIEGFEPEAWKQDKMACKGKREKFMAVLSGQKQAFLGMSQTEVIKILGRPDFQEISKRNLKYYYYYYLPGPQCEGSVSRELNASLQVRFNNVGYVNEVLIHQ